MEKSSPEWIKLHVASMAASLQLTASAITFTMLIVSTDS